ncbi:hypothetical protein D9599_19450 [Roseomonas sp. KE2513]|uniref:hypothetical protein n=1 Tax=Roseomonas sp. KE2513 TaxID=2479202 RepID=UPI0018E0471D|nr:hypothetical protein [Roseomonas sp. KE2513]MBI0537741.1 hypothetical protein [Roseomonas sp. KE2513]
MSGATQFRSVNLREDLLDPRRLAHYQPTTRSAPVVRAVLESGARMVIAAYGSGKSLAAGVGCLLVANGDKAVLRDIVAKMGLVEPDLAIAAERRMEQREHGRVIVLSGHVRDLPGALCEAVGVKRGRGIEAALDALEAVERADRIAIVWDEFGRHLEGIVSEGRSRELDAVQRLAEWTVRAREPSASLTLLLHQNLLAYATVLNQTSRNEWRKIEGRLEQIRFVEDSQELYELAATAISERRPEGVRPPNDAVLRRIARGAIAAGWFDGMSDEGHVATLLGRAYPVSAAALHVLPRLVARIGQNERSLFGFIDGVDLSRPIGMEEVYQGFADAMRSDVGIGGSHRRWVETETARSRAVDVEEREALAAACLLQMGVDGERRRLARSALEAAVSSRGGLSADRAAEVVEVLVARKLLLHRKLNDDVSIWHGADVDLASRVRDERARRMQGFDLLTFLEAQHPAPFVRPTGHNLKFGTARYLTGRYVHASDVGAGAPPPAADQGKSEWGQVYYVLADSAEELERARKRIEGGWPGSGRALVVLPSEPISVFDAALEIDALIALQADSSLATEDPLIRQELTELLAVARRQLAVLLHRLTTDRPNTAEWWRAGERLRVNRDHPAGVAASALLDTLYPQTPRIVNDQLMRNRLSRQMETARVRMLTRILERGGDPRLGYREEELTSAEGSVLRTVLEETGLYSSGGDTGHFAAPEDLQDPGLRAAWTVIAEFFQTPGRRSLADVVSKLSEPPIGVPAGVLPLLVVSGFKAFGRAVSLRVDGAYPTDVLGFDASRMFLEPQRIEVEVHPSDDETRKYLSDLAYIFSHRTPGPTDEAVRFASDALTAWRRSLSEGVRRSRRHTDDGRKLMNLLADIDDPPRLILLALPEAFGNLHKGGRFVSTLRVAEKARADVDRLVEGYTREAVEVVAEVLSLRHDEDPVAGVQTWIRCFDVPSLLHREDLTMIDKAVLRTAKDTTNGRYTAESLARAVSSVLLQRGIDRWEDGTASQMRKVLRECRARIEDAALSAPEPGADLEEVINARIEALQAQLKKIRENVAPVRLAAGGTR